MLKDLTRTTSESEEFVANAIATADPNALRMALYQATRDPELAAMKTEAIPFWGNAFTVIGLAPEHHATVRAKALDFIRQSERTAAPAPTDKELDEMMVMFAGEPVNKITSETMRGYLDDSEFPLGVEWRNEPSAEVKQAHRVVIIGAGLGGMAAAIQLEKLGIPWTIIERHSGVGGTWWINNYPEARVDVPSHHYQYTFMKNYPWKHFFATRDELAEYADAVAGKYNLKPKIRLNTKLTGAQWDEASASWKLTVEGPDGATDTLDANTLISAAGLFNQPNMPDIPGIDSFKGKMFHTTAWDHSYDYTGKKVGQIGVGSTGAQLMPAIAAKAEHLTVYQRSPQWISSFPGYRDAVPKEVHWLFDNFPHYRAWYDFSTSYTLIGGDPTGVQDIDREYQARTGGISARSDAMRKAWMDYMESKIGHRPDLVKKLTPDFPPFAKRPVVDNGWFDALNRDNVDLVTDPIERITEKGIRTADGQEREFDFIILGAGFKAERYLWPVQYVGRNGRTLEQAWDADGARAYAGVNVSGFPNLFILYGPNAQARGGGIITWLELWARYAVQSVVSLIETGKKIMDVKEEVQTEYNEKLDVALADCIWPLAKSYYVTSGGRQIVNMPWTPNHYYDLVREPNAANYNIS